MSDLGRILVFVGLALVVIGGVVWLLGRAGFRGMPGDIRYESDSVRIYFPIVTCIVLSLLLTAIFWIIRWMRGG